MIFEHIFLDNSRARPGDWLCKGGCHQPTQNHPRETMIIKINKRLKFFSTMRLHGQQSVADQVMRLHQEGWQPVNIASIAKVGIATVRQILKDKGIVM
jgi:hypothetical protein